MKPVFPLTIQNGLSQSGSYILFLCEPQSGIQVPIFIGAHEAQGILLAKEEIETRRPMTHQLIVKVMDQYGLSLKHVSIDRVSDGIFYATLHITDGFNTRSFDSRPSDAISLALLSHCPILMDDNVIDETGVTIPNANQNPENHNSIHQLEEQLRRCEESEEYERAAEIQQQIENLKNK